MSSPEISETQAEFDTTSALTEISSDLFGQDEKEKSPETASTEVKTPLEGEQVAAPGEPSAAREAPAPQSNSEEVQALGAPSTWSKEAIAEWATISPRAQQEILKREEDMFRGLGEYKTRAELGARYDAVIDPYRPILAAENLDPVEMFQAFAGNHYLLSRGTPEQKVQLAANLINHYGVDFARLVDHLGHSALEAPDPHTQALEQRLAAMERQAAQTLQNQQNAARAQVDSEVAAFAADPAHPFFNELSENIAKFISSGLATNLQDAYDMAVHANPVTRAKALLQSTSANPSPTTATRVDKIAKSTADHVQTTPTQRNGTVPLGSMDDTLQETLAAIAARG